MKRAKKSVKTIQWKDAHYWELEILKAMQVLFENHPELLTFVFHPTKAELAAGPLTTLSRCKELPADQAVLVRLALALWNGSHPLDVETLLERLTDLDFAAALRAMIILGPRRPRLLAPAVNPGRRADPAWANTLF